MFAKQFWNLESGGGIRMCRDFPAKANLCVVCLLMDDTNWPGWSERLQMGVKSSTTEMARGFSQIYQQIWNYQNNEIYIYNIPNHPLISFWTCFLLLWNLPPEVISYPDISPLPFDLPVTCPVFNGSIAEGSSSVAWSAPHSVKEFDDAKIGEGWRIPLTFTYIRWTLWLMGHLLDQLAQEFCPSINGIGWRSGKGQIASSNFDRSSTSAS